MSASSASFRSLTWLAPSRSPMALSSGSTCRTVTGSSAVPPGSARRSTTPNGAAANFTSGGIGPVATFSGNWLELAGARPEASTKPLGSATVYVVFSARVGANSTPSTTASPSLPSSGRGARGWPSPAGTRRTASAWLAVTGVLKRKDIGRNGRQADWAFSRSHENSTLNGSRTLKFSVCAWRVATPPGVATPWPSTSRTWAEGVSWRWQASATRCSGGTSLLFQPRAWIN